MNRPPPLRREVCLRLSSSRPDGCHVHEAQRSWQHAVVVLLVALAVFATACGSGAEPWLSVTPAEAAIPAAGASQVVLAIRNDGDGPDELVGASTPAALGVELHLTEVVERETLMRELESIRIPAGQVLRFQPGDLHLMLVVPDESVVEGASFDLTLEFARSAPVTIPVEVVRTPRLREDEFAPVAPA